MLDNYSASFCVIFKIFAQSAVASNQEKFSPQSIFWEVLGVFEPEFTTKTNEMALRLGIIKNIIENYKRTITFESTHGNGTTFRVLYQLQTHKTKL